MNDPLIEVTFVREGTINRGLDGYVNEIREDGKLLAKFDNKRVYGGSIDDIEKDKYYRVTVLLKPGDHEIQFCYSGKVIETATINPVHDKQVTYNRSTVEVFFEKCGLSCKVPVFIVALPIALVLNLILGIATGFKH